MAINEDGSDDKKGRDWKGGLKAAGKSLMSSGQSEMDRASSERITPVAYRKGGKIRKSKRKNRAVPIIAHENERVIPADKRKPVERLMKRAGMNLTDKKRGKAKRKKDRKDTSR